MTFRTSYSSIQRYSVCPRAWYLGEYLSLGPVLDKRTGALGFGTRVHAALEVHGKGGDPIETWHALSHHEYEIASERGWMTDELDKETALGLVMLEGLIEWEAEQGDDEEYEVIAVEHKVSNTLEIVLPSGEVVDIHLYGKLDQALRHRQFGTVLIKDWKTTRNLEEATKEGLETSAQPRIYQALLSQEMPDVPVVGVRYTIMRKVLRTGRAKPPFYFNYDLSMSEYNVAQHMERVTAHATRMLRSKRALDAGVPHGMAAPFNPTWQCKTCVFRHPCWTWQTTGEQAGRDMLEEQFVVVDPMSRYNDDTEEGMEV